MNKELRHSTLRGDEAFDAVIRSIPETLLQAPDDAFLEPAFSRDPFGPLGRLRDEVSGVVFRGADGLYAGQAVPNSWAHDLSAPHAIAVSHAAVSAIGSDFNRFVNRNAYGAHVAAFGETINCLDGGEHRWMRRLFDKAIFGRKAIEDWNNAITRPTVQYLVERTKRMTADREPVDGRRDLALPAAYSAISAIIGVPREDLAHFVELGEAAQSGPRDLQKAMKAVAALAAYFRDQLAHRRRSPRKDMITIMGQAVEAGRSLSDDDVVRHCLFLLPGGIETTWRETANVILATMLHPDAYRAATNDPTTVEPIVEEALRWAPSGFIVPRIAAADVTIDGVAIPAGASICSVQGVANRDPKVFHDPDQFDWTRTPNPHLTFHIGAHYCMGQHLARFLLRTMLETLSREIPDLKLACGPGEIEMRGFGVRCPARLPLAV